MSLSKTVRTLVAAATSNAAGSTTRGTQDCTTTYGGILTIKMVNGATGPTLPCLCNVLVAHNASTPTAASAGTDWKTITSFSTGIVASATVEQVVEIPLGVMQLEVEFTGNTGQPVTVEAYYSEVTTV